jgi:hypothetical protein
MEIQVWGVKRLKQPLEENRKLKQLVADLSLSKRMLRGALSKKRLTPALKREYALEMRLLRCAYLAGLWSVIAS